MQVSMKRVLGACEALWPLMEAKGLSGATQYAVMRLWAQLGGERAMYFAAELKLARECGTVGEDGKITFTDAESARVYMERREELLGEFAEIKPAMVKSEDALWAVMTPKALGQLEGILMIEEAAV